MALSFSHDAETPILHLSLFRLSVSTSPFNNLITFHGLKCHLGADEMAQWTKAHVAKSEDLNSINP